MASPSNRPYVVGKWVCVQPSSKFDRDICLKCGALGEHTPTKIRARGVSKIGYKLYEQLSATLQVPLCRRCDALCAYGPLLVVLSLVLGFLVLPTLAITNLQVLGLGLFICMFMGAPLVGFVAAILFYRRSCFNLGSIDDLGAIEIGWVHPIARRSIAETDPLNDSDA